MLTIFRKVNKLKNPEKHTLSKSNESANAPQSKFNDLLGVRLPESIILSLCEMFDKQINHEVYLEGANHILRQREFQDLMRLEQVLSALEQRQLLFKVFQRARLVSSDVVVLIGDELPAQEMFDCSVVTSPYHIHGRESGFIGVVGPTRMRYDQAVSAVSFMAKNLSQWLTQACIN